MKYIPPSPTNYYGELWTLSDKLPLYMLYKIRFDEYNYRILASPIKHLIKGTKCDIPKYPNSYKYPKNYVISDAKVVYILSNGREPQVTKIPYITTYVHT